MKGLTLLNVNAPVKGAIYDIIPPQDPIVLHYMYATTNRVPARPQQPAVLH